MLLSNSRFKTFFLYSFFLMAMLFLQNCAPVFSELQSAKLVGKDKTEVTASYSSVSFSNEGESETIQDHAGIQVAYGLSENIDVRARYEYIAIDLDPQLEVTHANVLGIGPKFNLLKDQAALYLPVGIGFGEDLSSEVWQIHPTLLYTYTFGNTFELNPSAKIIIPINGGGDDVLWAFNIGTALSTDLSKWAIRPEMGFMYNPGDDGHFMHYSIGLSIYP